MIKWLRDHFILNVVTGGHINAKIFSFFFNANLIGWDVKTFLIYFVIMFPVHTMWFQDPILKMSCMIPYHSVWTPFHSMYENSTLCTNWFVHQANIAGTFIVHQGNAAGAFIVHQGNVVEHFGSYIKAEQSSPTMLILTRQHLCIGLWVGFGVLSE